VLFTADHGGVREDGFSDGLLGGDVDEGYSTWLVRLQSVVTDVVEGSERASYAARSLNTIADISIRLEINQDQMY
jgi:hypothetical protein